MGETIPELRNRRAGNDVLTTISLPNITSSRRTRKASFSTILFASRTLGCNDSSVGTIRSGQRDMIFIISLLLLQEIISQMLHN